MKTLFACFFTISTALSVQQTDDVPIAVVGNITITAKEFVSRYELTPGLQRRKSQIEQTKGEFLLSLIAEKLLLLKARQDGLDTDTLSLRWIGEVEKMLVRDELYRTEISQKISISLVEIQSAMKKAQNELKIYFLFAADKKDADDLMAQIQKGKPLESFRFSGQLSEKYSGPDSAIARWGYVDERMESVIFVLPVNGTSQPIQLDDGWYIAKVMGKSITGVTGETELASLRERVVSTLRKRKETARMFEFMSRELKQKKAEINARLLQSIVDHVWLDAQRKFPIVTDSSMYIVDASTLKHLTAAMGDSLSDVLVTFPHTTWTGEQALEKISETNLATPHPSPKMIRVDMEQRLREIIDQEFLAQIGYQKGLHQSKAVMDDMKVWREAYIAQHVRAMVEDTIAVTQEDMREIRKIFQNDSAVVHNDEQAKEKVLSIKMSEATDRIVGGIANNQTITIYEKNFRTLEVTNTPSMVFRYIGFGGRMFAVPFVIPQVGWIRYWDQREKLIP